MNFISEIVELSATIKFSIESDCINRIYIVEYFKVDIN